MDASGWVIVIGAIGTNVVAILTAYFRLRSGQRDIQDQGEASHASLAGKTRRTDGRVSAIEAALNRVGIRVPAEPKRISTDPLSQDRPQGEQAPPTLPPSLSP